MGLKKVVKLVIKEGVSKKETKERTIIVDIVLHGFAPEYHVYVNTPFRATSLASWSIMVKNTHTPSTVVKLGACWRLCCVIIVFSV